MRVARVPLSGPLGVGEKMSALRREDREARALSGVVLSALWMVGRVSPFVWLALALAVAAPFYLRYFAWALGACGVVTFAPVR